MHYIQSFSLEPITNENQAYELKNFLRPFRGLHRKLLLQYVAMFEWLYNLEEVTIEFLRMLLVPYFTFSPI